MDQLTLLCRVRCDRIIVDSWSSSILMQSASLIATGLEWSIHDIGCQLMQIWRLICLTVWRSVIVLAREIHLCCQGLRRSWSQLVTRRTCVHAMAIGWISLLVLVWTEVVLHRVRPLTLIDTGLLMDGKVGEALTDAVFITICLWFDRCVTVLRLTGSVLAHWTIIYWLQVWQFVRRNVSIV